MTKYKKLPDLYLNGGDVEIRDGGPYGYIDVYAGDDYEGRGYGLVRKEAVRDLHAWLTTWLQKNDHE